VVLRGEGWDEEWVGREGGGKGGKGRCYVCVYLKTNIDAAGAQGEAEGGGGEGGRGRLFSLS